MNIDQFLHLATEVLPTREAHINSSLCDAFFELSKDDQAALKPAMDFIGCDGCDLNKSDNRPVQDKKKQNSEIAAKIMLLSLYIKDGEPKWSSNLIEELWRAVLEPPDGQYSDLFNVLYIALHEYQIELTNTVANFIRDILRFGKTASKYKYSSKSLHGNFEWIPMSNQYILPSQAYFIFSVVKLFDVEISEDQGLFVLQSLSFTSYWNGAVDLFSETLNSQRGKLLLSNWLNEGIDSELADTIQALINS